MARIFFLLLLVAPGCASIRLGAGVLVDTNGAVGAQGTVGIGLGYATSEERMLFFCEDAGLGPSEEGVDYVASAGADLASLPEDTGAGWRVGGRLSTRGTLMQGEFPTIGVGPRATALWAFDHSATRDDGEKFQLYSGTLESWQSVGLEGGFDVTLLPQADQPAGIATLSAVYEITSRYE